MKSKEEIEQAIKVARTGIAVADCHLERETLALISCVLTWVRDGEEVGFDQWLRDQRVKNSALRGGLN